jgi:rSAM/selenodomain-associated transferase 2
MDTEPFVSIVIPTLNEADNVPTLVRSLVLLPEAEIIVADGGSTDGTREWLQEASRQHTHLRWLAAPRGRARQMNAAASVARGHWLIFLHADTRLPLGSYQAFTAFVRQNPATCGGAFTFRVAHERLVYRYLEWYVAQRCRLLKMPFGDQALYACREDFWRLGGYREDFPLMEDMEFVERLNKLHGFCVIDAPVFTSARRFEQEGYLKRTLSNVGLQMLYKIGVHPSRLAALYYR